MIGISRLYCGRCEPSDHLRYRRAEARAGSLPLGPVVVFNCTRRCNLRCRHCYTSSGESPAEGAPAELSTPQAEAMLEDLAAFGVPVVLFSGGEPLMRPDVTKLAARAVALGMRAVLSTNGTLIDARTADRLRAAGVSYAGVSLDGLEGTNDRFRGREGAFRAALEGIRNCRRAGLKVGLRFTLNPRNVGDLDGVFALLRDEEIPRVCFYHLVYTGRGAALQADDLTHEQTRRAVDTIINRTTKLHADGLPKEVLTVDNHADGPYLYLRMRRERNERAEEVLALLRHAGGNRSGERIACVSWDGTVHPDQFSRHVDLGNVTERAFSSIWSGASPGGPDRPASVHPLLARLRNRRAHLKGRCAACRFLDACGGNLRVRAEAVTGDLWAPDPACYLTDEEITRPGA